MVKASGRGMVGPQNRRGGRIDAGSQKDGPAAVRVPVTSSFRSATSRRRRDDGCTAVIQQGGRYASRSIDAANEYGMAMVFTSERHFRH